jgi:hypothetical protein
VDRQAKTAAMARGVRATPHPYRHYGATAMVRASVDIRSQARAVDWRPSQSYYLYRPPRLILCTPRDRSHPPASCKEGD